MELFLLFMNEHIVSCFIKKPAIDVEFVNDGQLLLF